MRVHSLPQFPVSVRTLQYFCQRHSLIFHTYLHVPTRCRVSSRAHMRLLTLQRVSARFPAPSFVLVSPHRIPRFSSRFLEYWRGPKSFSRFTARIQSLQLVLSLFLQAFSRFQTHPHFSPRFHPFPRISTGLSTSLSISMRFQRPL